MDNIGLIIALVKSMSHGEGKDGKSAYQYAVEGGYTGTEEEFAAKLAEEMPEALPNPNALTFTGAVTGSYDGSEAVTVEIPASGGGLTTAQVKALDGMFKVCAFIKADVSEEYNAFRTAFNIEAATITGISATYSGGNVTAGTSVNELTGIVVTAIYSDGSKQTVTGYTLSGTIAEGSNTITVTYEGMTTTFTVTGVAEEVTLTSISVTYSGGPVPAGTALDDLTGIVVTAQYSDGSTETVTGYTLSGTLAEGTSTITVSYGGKTDTFDVVVTHQNDTTAEIATEGYVFTSLGNHTLRENGGITVKYQLDAPTTVLHPAGIIPVLFSSVSAIGNLTIYKDDTYLNYVSEFETASVGRWGQLASGELAEYNSKSWNVAEYNQISFSVDLRCIDDAYMYDYTSGQVWFAGKNTPYYGKTNISEAVT